MKLIKGIMLLALVLPSILFGQTKKVSVYFDNDKFVLRNEAKQIIDSFFNSLQNTNLTKISIKGNADNSADSLYNFKLSEKRTETVVNYIVTKGINSKIISSDYFGENKPITTNETEEGKQINRRVDITVAYKKIIPKPDTVILPKKEISKKDSCRKDTVIVFPGGTQVSINTCEFLELIPCLGFEVATTPNSIMDNGMTLMDTNGVAISSCGMLKITLKPGCSNKDCFKNPITVRFPAPTQKECDYCGKNARVYIVNNIGSWNQQPGNRTDVKTVKINGKDYYQFEVKCPNIWKNCDCKTRGTTTKFKVKKGYKILSLKIIYDCPVMVVKSDISKNKTMARAKLICPTKIVTVTGVIMNSKGDTLYLKPTPINDLPKKLLHAPCKKNNGYDKQKLLGFIRFRERGLYSKYFIKPKQLTTTP